MAIITAIRLWVDERANEYWMVVMVCMAFIVICCYISNK
jgi:hypothetical protein